MAVITRIFSNRWPQKSLISRCMYLESPYSIRPITVANGSKAEAVDLSRDAVNISDSCIKRLTEIIDDESFLRVYVEGGGCSGFQYKFDLDKDIGNEDVVFEKKGVKIVIDEKSLKYIKGSTIEYHSELIRSGFRIIDNPQAAQGCSCGASFNIKIP